MEKQFDSDSLKSFVHDVPDFPKAGIIFRDINPLLAQPGALKAAAAAMTSEFSTLPITHVIGIESRGFLFGSIIAQDIDRGFSPIRKQGKLPGEVVSETYNLEYGTETLEIQTDAIGPGDRILLVDDVLATGGTLSAAERLVAVSYTHLTLPTILRV